MTRFLRIAVVGTGWWGSDIHIPALLARDDAQVIALCDTNAERLAATAGKYDISRTYTDLNSMLVSEELDGVVVASSNASHYPVCKQCLEHGVHVLVEKPMTIKAQEARDLLELASQNNLKLLVGYPFNLTPVAARVQHLLASGELGNIQYVNGMYNSFMTPFFSGNFPYQYAVHQPTQYQDPQQLGGGHGQVQLTHLVGLLFFLTGLEPLQVSALMTNQQFSVDLVNAMTVGFAGGAIGTLGGTGNQKGLTFKININCERGWIDMDAAIHQALIFRHDHEVETLAYKPETPISHGTSHHFVDILSGKIQHTESALAGQRAVALLEAAYRSAEQQGKVIQIKELYENIQYSGRKS